MLSNVMVNEGFRHQKEEKPTWGIHRNLYNKIKHEVQQKKMLNINSDALSGRPNETTGYL